jgi:hypothetical protein
LGSGPNMGPQTDPKLVLTKCHNCSARAWPYKEWRTEMMPGNINSRGQIGVLVQIWPPKRDPKLAPTECHSTGRPHASRMRVTVNLLGLQTMLLGAHWGHDSPSSLT